MADLEKVMDGPFSDINTRNLVLQLMSEYPIHSGEGIERYTPSYSIRSLSSDELKSKKISKAKLEEQIKQIKKQIKEKGDAYQYSSEYFRAIADEEARMEAYRGLTVTSNVLYGDEAEIKKNPYKFLNIPENSDFGQVRAAWIKLAQQWYPDYVNPFDIDQLSRHFGNSPEFLEEGDDLGSWINCMKEVKPPETLTIDELSKLGDSGRENYYRHHRAYEVVQNKIKGVREIMIEQSNKKMGIINKAYKAAKDFYSDSEVGSLAGFKWERKVYEFISHQWIFDDLKLEGEGVVRREIGGVWDEPSICFDYGEPYLAPEGTMDYRHSIPLRALFGWMELAQNKELSPLLLQDIVDDCKLDKDKSEQLRQMLINKESTDFILKTLNVPRENKYYLLHPANIILNGPL